MAIGTTVFLYSVLLNLLCCDAYKLLLVFPIASRSHAILGEGYVTHLANAGHEITYITPLPMKKVPRGVRQIDISENMKYFPLEEIFDLRTLINREVDLQDVRVMLKVALPFANGTLHIGEVQKLLDDPKEEFDAVIIEWLYTEMFAGLAAVFNCPLIWSSSMQPHSMVLSLIDDYPNPAYTFHHLSRYHGSSFWHRVHQLWIMFSIRLFKWGFQSHENEVYVDIYEKFVINRGRVLPSYEDVVYNGSLMLGNSHVTSGEAISLPQNYKSIGGYHIEKNPEPLPENLQNIMDSAKHGVIYFSMGSMLLSRRIPESLKRSLLDMFGTLNQTVIWKLEEVLPDLPKNVHVLPWVPQTSVLAHPNCVLLIAHGGLLSLVEALHFEVPMIGIPQYGDQFVNTRSAEIKGYGKRVDLNHDGPKTLNAAIREILENSSYRERIREYSKIYHDRAVAPEKELVHWVEHVIKTQGAMHWRSPALLVPWYQKCYVDLAAVIISIIIMFIMLYKKLRVFYRSYFKAKML